MNVSDAINPRPVWARHLRREAGGNPGPATDDEKRDAIQVIRDGHLFAWAPGGIELLIEAERILDDG
jgi:hypothetical protein